MFIIKYCKVKELFANRKDRTVLKENNDLFDVILSKGIANINFSGTGGRLRGSVTAP